MKKYVVLAIAVLALVTGLAGATDGNWTDASGVDHLWSTVGSMTFKLRGLNPAASYTVTNFNGGTYTTTGGDLMNNGVVVNGSIARGSALLKYTKN
jgi:hypothetical protein